MLQQSNLPPVLDTFVGRDGNVVEICYHGTWGDLCRNYVKSLPQNAATKQEGNHAIAKDSTGQPATVGGRQPAGVGHGVRGSESGQ